MYSSLIRALLEPTPGTPLVVGLMIPEWVCKGLEELGAHADWFWPLSCLGLYYKCKLWTSTLCFQHEIHWTVCWTKGTVFSLDSCLKSIFGFWSVQQARGATVENTWKAIKGSSCWGPASLLPSTEKVHGKLFAFPELLKKMLDKLWLCAEVCACPNLSHPFGICKSIDKSFPICFSQLLDSWDERVFISLQDRAVVN